MLHGMNHALTWDIEKHHSFNIWLNLFHTALHYTHSISQNIVVFYRHVKHDTKQVFTVQLLPLNRQAVLSRLRKTGYPLRFPREAVDGRRAAPQGLTWLTDKGTSRVNVWSKMWGRSENADWDLCEPLGPCWGAGAGGVGCEWWRGWRRLWVAANVCHSVRLWTQTLFCLIMSVWLVMKFDYASKGSNVEQGKRVGVKY